MEGKVPAARIRGYNGKTGTHYTTLDFATVQDALERLSELREMCPEDKFSLIDFTARPKATLVEYRGSIDPTTGAEATNMADELV